MSRKTARQQWWGSLRNALLGFTVALLMLGSTGSVAASIYPFTYNGEGSLSQPLQLGEGVLNRDLEIILLNDLSVVQHPKSKRGYLTIRVTNHSEDADAEFYVTNMTAKLLVDEAGEHWAYFFETGVRLITVRLAPQETADIEVNFGLAACGIEGATMIRYRFDEERQAYWNAPCDPNAYLDAGYFPPVT